MIKDKKNYLVVEDSPHLIRDAESNAILNVNETLYNNRKLQKKKLKQKKNEIQQLKNDINEIKRLLEKIVENK